MESIGGYFELELRQGKAMHSNLVAVNSARNALVYLIKAKKITVINMPHFNCHVVAEAVRRFCPETTINFYHVGSDFIPLFDNTLLSSAPLYYVNYYGLQEHVLRELTQYNVILDNSQAFYSQSFSEGDIIYSPRKFFGVCDGGYLQTQATLDPLVECDTSWEHATYLLKRIDCGPTFAYGEFRTADTALEEKPPLKMSKLTQQILAGINYETIQKIRRKNFGQLHKTLGDFNKLLSLIEIAFSADSFVPLCYPYMSDSAEALRNKLIENRIYVPTYWPELKLSSELNEIERSFVNKIVCLPIDQRYGNKEMQKILNIIRNHERGVV